ncbi:hypothetical protein [Roseibium sp. LAB1]
MAVRDALVSMMLAGVFFSSPAAAAPPDCRDFTTNDRLDTRDQRWCQALAFREKYLEGGKFVEKPPSRTSGSARDIHSRLATSFASSGSSSVTGSVTIGQLKGFFRLKLAGTSNTLYYSRKIRISGSASTSEGSLEIYSPIDINLWDMAAVLVDNPDRNAPPPEEGLILKGYVVTKITPGAATPFSANLQPMAGDYLLLLNAPDGTAGTISIDIDGS